MDNFYLSALVQELTPEVLGNTVARLSVDGSTLLIDLRLASDRQLVASLDRTSPALYLSNEYASRSSKGRQNETYFLSLIRKHLVGARLVRLFKPPSDRIIYLEFEKHDVGDNKIQLSLQLFFTGRSANAYLADAGGEVIGTLFEQATANRSKTSDSPDKTLDLGRLARDASDTSDRPEVLYQYFGEGSPFGPQLKNEFLERCNDSSPVVAFRSLVEDLTQRAPLPLVYSKLSPEQIRQVVINPKTDLILSHIELAQARDMQRFQYPSLSEAADKYYSLRAVALALRSEYATLKQSLAREIAKRVSVLNAIDTDRSRFGEPETLKRYGDLLLANLANARIEGTTASVIDYYDPSMSVIQIELPEGATIQEAATAYFTRYQKARRALAAISSREQEVSTALARLNQLLKRLEDEPTESTITDVSESLNQLLGTAGAARSDNNKQARGKGGVSFGRRFKSTDGYEIVVGRNDRDNDTLTFRVAKPHDIWLHAADYPGSHAIIRIPTRETPPHRTITEAAELAAFYSQAKREGKAAVHYTQKKFVSKPPRSKPGLVRLSSFKTILVEPRCTLERMA